MAGWFHGKSDKTMDDLEVPWIGNLREYSSNRQTAIFSHGTSMESINCVASKPHFLLKNVGWKVGRLPVATLRIFQRAVQCIAKLGKDRLRINGEINVQSKWGWVVTLLMPKYIYIHIFIYIYLSIYIYIYIMGFGVHQVLINIDQPLSILKQEPRQQKHGFHLIHQGYSTLPN